MSDKPIKLGVITSVDARDPDHPNSTLAPFAPKGKELSKKQVLDFINSLPDHSYFIKWDYGNPGIMTIQGIRC